MPLTANVTRWQASVQPGARVYDELGLPSFEAPGEGGKRQGAALHQSKAPYTSPLLFSR